MRRISLVLSDVDGTLVTSDKRLTEANRSAVRRLHAAGIGFSITSSRPPFGLAPLAKALDLQAPFGAFNGGALVEPGGTVLEQHLIPEEAVRQGLALLAAAPVDIWFFTADAWLVRDPAGAYVDHERRTLQSEPTPTASYDPYLGAAAKIVGVSGDFALLADCETRVRAALGGLATVIRSQRYYLDLTAPGVDKGTVVDALSRRLAIPADEIVTIGDMENDVAMFRKSGFSIAMGNAPPEVQRAADAVTTTNDADGLAAAIDRFILA